MATPIKYGIESQVKVVWREASFFSRRVQRKRRERQERQQKNLPLKRALDPSPEQWRTNV